MKNRDSQKKSPAHLTEERGKVNVSEFGCESSRLVAGHLRLLKLQL